MLRRLAGYILLSKRRIDKSHGWKSCCSSASSRVVIVGSGPAGFYTAQHLLKLHPKVLVDIIDSSPVPFGLVRYGVAPDHPEVKNVINTFINTARNPRLQFYGNVHVGGDISLAALQSLYSAVILAYGANEDNALGIPGEDLKNVVSAREFVGWYNGAPEQRSFKVNLANTDTAVVIGHGNVAIDVARLLLTPAEELAKTDITDYALSQLRHSEVRRVILLGRRGPLQVSFTTAELREMTKLSGVTSHVDLGEAEGFADVLADLPRPRRRLMELIRKTAESTVTEWPRSFHLRFYRRPLALHADLAGNVSSLTLGVNKVNATGLASDTGAREDLPAGLVLRSVGYRSTAIDERLPFSARGALCHSAGRVRGMQGLYCSGWVKTGPVGVIASTMSDSFETAQSVNEDLCRGLLAAQGADFTLSDVTAARPVTFPQWENIDAEEQRRGMLSGKPREKICSVPEMLEIAHRNS